MSPRNLLLALAVTCAACTGGHSGLSPADVGAEGTSGPGQTTSVAGRQSGGASIPADAGAPASQLSKAGFDSFVADNIDCAFIGTARAISSEAQKKEFSFAGLDWVVYYDVVAFEVDSATPEGLSPSELTLHPARCEAFKAGVRQPRAMLSECVDRKPSNMAILGERAIYLASRTGTLRLELKLPISEEGAVDLGMFDEAIDASASETLLRIQKILSSP